MIYKPSASREAAASRPTSALLEDFATLALFLRGPRHQHHDAIVATIKVIREELAARDVRIPQHLLPSEVEV